MASVTKLSTQEVADYVDDVLAYIQQKFTYKNGNYASEDGFHNFRQTAIRVYGNDSRDSMFKVLMTYMDKHLCTLAKNGFQDSEFVDRFEDVIVYSCLALAMYRSMSNE